MDSTGCLDTVGGVSLFTGPVEPSEYRHTSGQAKGQFCYGLQGVRILQTQQIGNETVQVGISISTFKVKNLTRYRMARCWLGYSRHSYSQPFNIHLNFKHLTRV